MAWIKTIEESEATGELKTHYEKVSKIRGFVPNIQKINSLKPELLRQYYNFSRSVTFGGSSLGRKREEMIAVVVSALIGCKY